MEDPTHQTHGQGHGGFLVTSIGSQRYSHRPVFALAKRSHEETLCEQTYGEVPGRCGIPAASGDDDHEPKEVVKNHSEASGVTRDVLHHCSPTVGNLVYS